MSYYILPKKNAEFELQITFADEISPCLSHSLCFFLNETKEQMKTIIIEEATMHSQHMYDLLIKMRNPFTFVFHKVPHSHFSVSKLKPYSNTFYIFMELIQMFSLLDFFDNTDIQTAHYGDNGLAIMECLDMLREDKKDIHIFCSMETKQEWFYEEKKKDILTYELLEPEYNDPASYILGLLYISCHIIRFQAENGIAIIKVKDIVLKPVIDILYILTTMYEKVYILKPNNTDMCESERFIICKHFIERDSIYKTYLFEFNKVLHKEDVLNKDVIVTTLLKKELPCLFLNKIEESNIIIGNQQLEYMQQMISLFKSKNREEKCEMWKKNNIQKCIKWCEKYKIPYNKFTDRVNIFLQIYQNETKKEYDLLL